MPRKKRGDRYVTYKQLNKKLDRDRDHKAFVFDGSTAVLPSYDNPFIQILTDVAAGDAYSNRDGNSILAKSFQFRYSVANNNHTAALSFRVIVFQWFEDGSNNAPVVSDIITDDGNTSTAATTDTTITGVYSIGTKEQYRILYDKTHLLGGDTLATGAGTLANWRRGQFILSFVKKRLKRKITFNVDAENNNHIYVLAISSVTDASGNEPDFQFSSKLTFVDP